MYLLRCSFLGARLCSQSVQCLSAASTEARCLQELGNGSAPQPEEQQSSAAETGVSGLSLDEKPAQEEGAPDEQPANAAHDPADAPELGTQPLGADGALMGQDELAEHCLLCGLQSLQDAELPIMTSDFYSKHMLPAKPPGKRGHIPDTIPSTS